MAIKTKDLNARLFGKADKRRATNVTEAQTAAKDKAAVIELAIAGEETVAFELIKINAAEVKTKTQVFSQNAREQAFSAKIHDIRRRPPSSTSICPSSSQRPTAGYC